MEGKIKKFIKRFSKEIIIALIFAAIAAIAVTPFIEKYEKDKKAEILKNIQNAVAKIIILDKNGQEFKSGSGVFINNNGLLATNFHVIEGAYNIFAKLPSGAFYQLNYNAPVIYENRDSDIAILQFDAQNNPYVEFGDSDKLKAGDEVVAIGSPLGLENSISNGVISNPKRNIKGIYLIQFTAPISSGNSGGGLFKESRLVGLTSGSLELPPEQAITQNLNFAIPINWIKNLLSKNINELTKNSAPFYYSLGNLADNKHDFNSAENYYKKAIELDPNLADAYLGLGGIYYEKGDYALELINYRRAAELDPNNSDNLYYLATALEDNGAYQEAVTTYEKALKLEPDNKEALHDLGILYLTLGKYTEAERLVSRLILLDPSWGNELKILINKLK
jgi:S1-C subfamily serine protease